MNRRRLVAVSTARGCGRARRCSWRKDCLRSDCAEAAGRLASLGAILLAASCTPPPPTMPDLFAQRTAPGYCRIDESAGRKRLLVTVSNRGAPFETPSNPEINIKVVFPPHDGQFGYPGSSQTNSVPSGFTFSQGLNYELFFDIPLEAFRPDLIFTITVDDANAVNESDETNNTVSGVCAG